MVALSDEPIVLCVAWGQQRVPSVLVRCHGCGRALAMSKAVRRELPAAQAACRRCAAADPHADEPILLPESARAEAERLGYPTDGPMPTVAEWARRLRPW